MKKILKISFLLVVAAGLVACGGGGGGSSTTQNPATAAGVSSTPYTPFALTTALVTSVPARTYPPGSEEESAFNLLNAERQACGFGLLAQNAALDQSSKAHADWLLINNYTGHNEIAATVGYTGVTSFDRMGAANYAPSNQFYGIEAEGDVFFSNKTGLGSIMVRRLLNAPYHSIYLLAGQQDVGVAVRSSIDTGTSPARAAVVINAAYKNATGPQAIAVGGVSTYPCQGSTGVEYSMTGESPNPVPGRNLSTNPLGSSVMVMVNPNQVLTINSASIINVGTGSNVTLRAPVGYTNDTNLMLRMNEGYVAADAPLSSNTSYQVTIAGTVDTSTAFSRTFTFTTKP